MKNQDKHRTNNKSRTKKSNANDKSKNAQNGLASNESNSTEPRKNTRGKQKNQNPHINFDRLKELCVKNGFGDSVDSISDAEICRCINHFGKNQEPTFTTTTASIGKYRKGNTGIRFDTLLWLSACLGVNPQYLTGESNFPAIKAPETIIDDNGKKVPLKKEWQYGNKYLDFNELLEEEIKKRNKAAQKEKQIVLDIMIMLGYYPFSDGEHFYLNIPEEKKAAIPNYEQWANMEKGLPITPAEREYLLSQLKSVLDLFENTIINYYTSIMAAFNMIEHEHLKAYYNPQSFSDGLQKLRHASPEEKEYWKNYFANLPADDQKEPEPQINNISEPEPTAEKEPKPKKNNAAKRKTAKK